MADNNTYTSKQNIKKYTTQAKFDAIDKSDVPVGTEYNIVGSITESDLDSDLQAKVNESVTGDGLTTEVTDGKVKVKNPMTFEGQRGVELNSTNLGSAYSTGTTYVFPNSTPLGQDYVNGHFPIGIVPIIGATDSYIIDNTSATTTYQGIFLPNAYDSNNYDVNAYAMITMTRSNNSGNQIYILPYCGSNPGVSYLLNQESIQAGSGSNMSIYRDNEGKVWLSAEVPGSPDIPTPIGTDYRALVRLDDASGPTWQNLYSNEIRANYLVHTAIGMQLSPYEDGTIYQASMAAVDGGSGYSSFVLIGPTTSDINETHHTMRVPFKSGTLATTDDITAAITGKQDNLTSSSSLDIHDISIDGERGGSWSPYSFAVTATGNMSFKTLSADIDFTPNGGYNFNTTGTDKTATFNLPVNFDAPGGVGFVMAGAIDRRQYILGTTAPAYATGNMIIYLPNREGTLALLSDIPASPTGNFMPDTPSGPYAMLVAYGGIGNTPTWRDIRDGGLQANYLVLDASGASYNSHTTGAIFEAYNRSNDTVKKFTLMAPTGDVTATVTIPNKTGTLATLDDIPTGGTTYTAGKNIEISGTTIAVADNLTRLYSLEIKPSNDAPTASLIVLNTNGGSIIDVNFVGKNTRILPNTDTTTGYEAIRLPSGSGTLVTDASFKTLFGNQNIVGSGNIDLYNHFITIIMQTAKIGKHAKAFVKRTSSNNLEVNSLTDLKTLFGNTFQWDANGYVVDKDDVGEASNSSVIYGITESGLQYVPRDGSTPTSFAFATANTLTIVDTVTTV